MAKRYSLLADIAEHRTIRDATKALQATFSAAKVPLGLPTESRRLLQNFVEEHEAGITDEESSRANVELKNFWERHVGESPAKLAVFVGVLRELRPAIFREAHIIEWWQLVVKPVITGTGYKKAALDDAQDFLVGCLVGDDDDDNEQQPSPAAKRLLSELLNIYLARTRGLTEDDQFIAPENAQVTRQIEGVLMAFGKKEPKQFFHSVDDLLTAASTRLQALTLLSNFLTEQTPHLYLVINTPLIEHLLKSLMNDTSTTVLSAALACLIMLLPHIPGDLGPHLPRMFLVYSRLLCWEKFSPFSTEAQRSTVTDDRVPTEVEDDRDPGDVGIDTTWEKARPKDLLPEADAPELMNYFTSLYGLYPLNFMSYIRKPRRYLKNLEFPGADDFDLDQTVIRSRTEQFRQVHLLHSNFFNMTVEEELIDPKWPKMDSADVVAECQALCIQGKATLFSPGPPPSARLPDLPPIPPLTPTNVRKGRQISPVASHSSFRSGTSWRDTQSTAVSARVLEADSPTLRAHGAQSDDELQPEALQPRGKTSASNRTSPNLDDFPPPGRSFVPPQSTPTESQEPPSTNLAHLQREIIELRTKLNFEKWHKASYSQHISQLMRKNVKDATAEAEHLNLLNANRSLKLQLEQVRNAREATVKDSNLTRKQAGSLEANMTERFNKLKQEQETWRADADELRRLRKEIKQYREILVATEERELQKSHQLEIVKRKVEKHQDMSEQLQRSEHKLREFEYREWEFDRAKREQDILQNEMETLQMKLQRHEQDRERTRRAYSDRVAQLEAQLGGPDSFDRGSRNNGVSPDTQYFVQQAIADSQAKLVQLKKAHARLLEKYTDLELEYQSVKSQLDALQGSGNGRGFPFGTHDRDPSDTMSGGGHDTYDILSDYNPISDQAYTTSTSDPTQRRYQAPLMRGMPVTPPTSEAAVQSGVGLTFKPPMSRQESMASRSSGAPATFNQTAPLAQDDLRSHMSDVSVATRKAKIQPDSQVRVYGRGKSLQD